MKISNKITPERAQELQIALKETIRKIGQCQVQIMNYNANIETYYGELKKIQKELWGLND